jgi:hypothetical protein
MKFVIAGFALLLSVPALAEPASAPADAAAQAAAKTYSRNPTGDGDPNAITCRPPQSLPGSRLRGPEACRTNAQWAQYEKDGMVLSADGVHFQPSEKMRTLNPQACHPATMGGGGTAAMLQANISQVCE